MLLGINFASWHVIVRFVLSSGIGLLVLFTVRQVLTYENTKYTVPFRTGLFLAQIVDFFIVVGGVFVVVAAERWSLALLWAGAALFCGTFIGILFGVPMSTATAAVQPQAPVPSPVPTDPAHLSEQAEPAPVMGSRQKTLLVETASWISKFLAGASFAQARNILHLLGNLSLEVGSYVEPQVTQHPGALGGGILLYFASLGFMCGLLLPPFFLEGF